MFAESFTVLSVNEIGAETFKALQGHSRSLKTLGLLSLERPGLQSLNKLGDCLALETLALEAASGARLYPWATECKGVFEEVAQWLRRCSSLRELEFILIPSSTTILAQVLKEPTIRLTALSLEAVDVDNEFYSSLTRQSQLRRLLIKILDDDLLEDSDQRHLLFADAICYCRQLRDLDTNELLTVEDLDNISRAVPTLEEIVLNGDSIDDEFLIPLSRLSKLKSLSIFNPSNISASALLRFLREIGQSPAGHHEGLQVYIANQNAEFRFSDKEEAMVAGTMLAYFKGRFEINYRQDPDELHESDFSD